MKKILISFLNILLLFVLFSAGTYAWFTDSAVNSDNTIQVGNLKASIIVADGIQAYGSGEDLYYDLNTNNIIDLKLDTQAMFDFGDLVEPGETLTRYIRVKNIGSILMAYKINFLVTEEFLDDYVEFTITQYSIEDGTPYQTVSVVKGSELTDTLVLMSNESALDNLDFEIFRVDMKILETLGNDYNYDTLSSEAFVFDVSFKAWQANYPESEPV
ncbi:MAG: SipW-dependent-type signal peptide-containing protein [Candidatus Izemoplasmatales bacterium]